jgi:hypothetical protein
MKLHVQTPVASKKKKSYYLQHRKTNTPCSHLYVKSKKKLTSLEVSDFNIVTGGCEG